MLSETPTKKSKPSASVSSRPRRGNTWLQQLGELKSADVSGGAENAENERNGEDSSSSMSTFNDALSNLSAASNTAGIVVCLLLHEFNVDGSGTRPLDFSSFIDDEAKEVNNGGLDEDEGEEASDGRCG